MRKNMPTINKKRNTKNKMASQKKTGLIRIIFANYESIISKLVMMMRLNARFLIPNKIF